MFDTDFLLLSMLVSSVGAGLFIYGKKQARLPHLLVGAIFTIYPYFCTQHLVLMAVIAVLLLLLLWGATRVGM